MKVVRKKVEPVFIPITITLETKAEYYSLLATLGSSHFKGELQELDNMGITVTPEYESPSDNLHVMLQNLFNEIRGEII